MLLKTLLAAILLSFSLVHADEMTTELLSAGPSPSLGEEARVWDRFVGVWDTDFSFHLKDGSVRHQPGEVRFAWVLNGRAIQDLWISYPKEGEKEREIGTSLRFYDAKAKTWNVLYVNPKYPGVLSVKGGQEGDRIILRGKDDTGILMRWSFNDIQADAFLWRGETSHDGGKTWQLEEEHHMKRRRTDGNAAGAAFKELSTLAGKWKGPQDATLDYTVTADGTALMEVLQAPKSAPMITMYTVDGDHLLATHYCSLGNQPQMATGKIMNTATNTLDFELIRVTGMKSPEDWHNTGLKVLLQDRDHFTQEWSFLYKGKAGNSTFNFTRTAP